MRFGIWKGFPSQNMRPIRKPSNWNSLPFCAKIEYYGTQLDESYAPYVDKLEAKRIVKTICPSLNVANVIRVLESPDDISEADFCADHILKSSHGSGWNILLDPSLEVSQVRQQLHAWNQVFSTTQKQYSFLKPRFFIEERVNDFYTGSSGKAAVFMFRCIRGVPVSVGVRLIHGDTRQNSYTPSFQLMEPPMFAFEKPSAWKDMLQYAKNLSQPFEFVRVDFYLNKQNKVYFSEFTFTPANGYPVYSMQLEHQLGRHWK